MRLQVQIGIECIVIPYDKDESVHTIALRAILKIRKLRPALAKQSGSKEYEEIRRSVGNSLIDPEDLAGDVLKDGDFIIIVINQNETEEYKEKHRQIKLEASRVELEKLNKPKKFNFEAASEIPHMEMPTKLLVLDGASLMPADLLSVEVEERIRKARSLLEKIASEHRVVYGVTTGFGIFSNVRIADDELKKLQVNLIRSHATGYGQPLHPSKVRMLLALRINVFAKGYSGISLENVKKMVAAFNAFCVSYVPQQGTVGCSGDLAPLAHLALGLLGEGKMWSPLTGWDNADVVLEKNNLKPLELGPKEGLALINGTQMVTAIGAYALERAYNIARQADVIAALSLDILKGTTRAFDPDIHLIRPHRGQNISALRLRSLLHSDANPSQIAEFGLRNDENF
ncbi:phenylalanine and histidine ammonia-lyase [Dictyocaulus viviparus]|uniref:Phenylalanine and histidine ammonia-lyase n=1 Tax=Dictyocaulus viviparus TaxID=29172 RepID=A0A0D8XGK9_DICVI|nr:phenylalanine and histidine ammonia-lyase [Dictyocaulus viviparus]